MSFNWTERDQSKSLIFFDDQSTIDRSSQFLGHLSWTFEVWNHSEIPSPSNKEGPSGKSDVRNTLNRGPKFGRPNKKEGEQTLVVNFLSYDNPVRVRVFTHFQVNPFYYKIYSYIHTCSLQFFYQRFRATLRRLLSVVYLRSVMVFLFSSKGRKCRRFPLVIPWRKNHHSEEQIFLEVLSLTQ